MELSIVIPLLNENESIEELHQWISRSLDKYQYKYEIIFVDDGSTDNSWSVISRLAKKNANTRGLLFSKNYGKSQALHAGFKLSNGEFIVTMDADLQDSPEEIHEMVNKLKEKELDLISGWKKKRYDSILLKNIPSKLFNWAARKVSGIQLHDFNCGLKVYRKEVIKTIEVYGEMHRYIPVIASNEGFTKIDEQVVKHQARKYGITKFGSDRFINGLLDLITLLFLKKFGKRPMHFFGLIGTVMVLTGFIISIYIGYDKLFINKSGRLITERPLFYISFVTMLMGLIFFIAGFLGELILRSKPNNDNYSIVEKTN